MDVSTLLVAGGSISVIAVIQGLVRAARDAGLPSKYASLLSAGLGGTMGIATALFAGSAVYLGLIGGIAAGLMASGLYDLGKKTTV